MSSQLTNKTVDVISFMVYLLILLKTGESSVEDGQKVQCVIGKTLESPGDAVCTTRNKNKQHLDICDQ